MEALHISLWCTRVVSSFLPPLSLFPDLRLIEMECQIGLVSSLRKDMHPRAEAMALVFMTSFRTIENSYLKVLETKVLAIPYLRNASRGIS
ncbi:hypothetical protein BJ166DRAFT_151257 [Pestalotiopsis sp. NC0098]|nr:hypothetical protein BJ166DRAFT_151257 [Pestalotiopsis sp. NC0098]